MEYHVHSYVESLGIVFSRYLFKSLIVYLLGLKISETFNICK